MSKNTAKSWYSSKTVHVKLSFFLIVDIEVLSEEVGLQSLFENNGGMSIPLPGCKVGRI